jgi:hypothetical protein
MKTKVVLGLVGKILSATIGPVVAAISDAIDGGKATAEELSKRPVTVSIAFGGGDGEAIKAQVDIEADLPEGA